MLHGRQFYAQLTNHAIEVIPDVCTIMRTLVVCRVKHYRDLQAAVAVVIAYAGCVLFCLVQCLVSSIVQFYILTIVDW